jgi:hypothetical protein
MPRLLRPHIPLMVRCQVALKQSGEMWIEDYIREWKEKRIVLGGLGELLELKLEYIALMLRCERKDLRLDHNPALGAREKVFRKGVHVGYRPDANDPDHLIYREKHAHHIKTNVRGDGAQHPDRVLIKRERKRLNKTKKKKRHKWGSRGFRSAADKSKPKRKWPKRSFK